MTRREGAPVSGGARTAEPRFAAPLASLLLLAVLSLLAACAGTPAPAISDSGPISLQGNCTRSDEDGFREQAHLLVNRGAVRELDWRIWVGRKGTCSFGLNEFEQTKSRPHIELQARDSSGCRLLVYQDPRRVTMAHAGCERRCTSGVHEEAWPVMFDPRSGGCASLDR